MTIVYVREKYVGIQIYLLLYADDILIVGKDKMEIARLIFELGGEFGMKDMGAANKILGIEILKNKKERNLVLSQKKHLQKMLFRFGLNNLKAVATPLGAHFKLSKELHQVKKKKS